MAKQVTSGEKFRFSARTYNDMNQLIESNRMGGLSMQAQTLRTNQDFVFVKNTSGINVNRYGILGISGIVFDPQTALPAFTSKVVFEGTVPQETQDGRFLICAEPIRNGAMGRCWADGIVITKVSVSDASHNYATILNNNVSRLKSAENGLCYILWKESGTGTKWAVLRFGGSGGSSVRWAFLKTTTGASNNLQAYLDKNLTGQEITVFFTLLASSNVSDSHYTLMVGTPLPVMKLNDNWWCLIPLQGVQQCT